MFDRDVKAEQEEAQAFTNPPVPAVVEQAIDTVARRLVATEYLDRFMIDFGDFEQVSESDWARIRARASELIKELDRGQGPFEAAYELLKRRAERES
jgi:hypothetical protein